MVLEKTSLIRGSANVSKQTRKEGRKWTVYETSAQKDMGNESQSREMDQNSGVKLQPSTWYQYCLHPWCKLFLALEEHSSFSLKSTSLFLLNK